MLEKDSDHQIHALIVAYLQKVTSTYVLPLHHPHLDTRSTVGARILSFAHQWELITQDLWILQGVKIGYVISFAHEPLYGDPIDRTSEHPRIVRLQGLQPSLPSF